MIKAAKIDSCSRYTYWVSAMANRTINFTAFTMNLQYQFAMFLVILAIVFSTNRVEN